MSINGSNGTCNCCGTPYNKSQETCVNCSYPVDVKKEETFLRSSIKDLQRVVSYSNTGFTVLELLNRYQKRLSYLSVFEHQNYTQTQKNTSILAPAPSQDVNSVSLSTPVIMLNSDMPAAVNQPPVPVIPERVFSFHSFFADQSINIVASLGAFLILVSSLSFIATEPNTVLAFLILLGVHVFFGLTGAFTFRFPSVRLVSVIYTAIFALQVPLLGFAFYELVNTKSVQISLPALIASVAIYAMIAYGALAIYQRFKPFGYFAAVSLAVADLATSWAFQLDIGWWFCAFFLPAFPLLLCVLRPGQTVRRESTWDILRGPAQLLMYACAYGSCSFAVFAFLTLLRLDGLVLNFGMRFSFALLSLLLLIWTCLFIRRVRYYSLVQCVPYLFFIALCLWLYVFMAQTVGYIIAFTLLGISYWVLTRRISAFSWSVRPVIKQLEFIVVVLALLIAFLSDPLIIFQMLSRSYGETFFIEAQFSFSRWLPLDLVAVLIGSALVFGVSINHFGWRKVPGINQRTWYWLVLLGGLLLNFAYNIVLLWSGLSLLWGLFAFVLMCVCATYVVRRLTDQEWAYPLALLSLCVMSESLCLSLAASAGDLTLVVLFYICFSYFLATYLRLLSWLRMPVILALLSLFIIFRVPQTLFVLNMVSPLLMVLYYRWRKSYPLAVGTQPLIHNTWLLRHRYAWPAFLIGLLYALAFILREMNTEISALSLWLALPDAFAVEMTLLSVLWYVAAVWTQKKWLLVVSTVFAGVAIQFPALHFWFLAGLAVGLMIIAAVVRAKAGRDWTLPFYLLALLTAVIMDRNGSTAGSSLAAAWMLLPFAGLTYLVSVMFEKDRRVQLGLLWSFTVLTSWSLYVISLFSDFYRLPLFTLAFACIGIVMHSVRHQVSENDHPVRRLDLVDILPIYTVACFAALLTGWSGIVHGLNTPFYAAVPTVLFVYALITYSIVLFEQKSVGLWWVTLFTLWGMLLLSTLVSCAPAVYLPLFGPVDCATQLQLVPYSMTGVVFACCALAMLGTRLVKRWIPSQLANVSKWVWYGNALVAASIICFWSEWQWAILPHVPMLIVFICFVVLALSVMFVERMPELILLVSVLSIWVIANLDVLLWFKVGCCCAFFVLVFASQFVWRYLPSFRHVLSATRLAQGAALGGQFLVIVATILSGGLLSTTGLLAHMGAGSLLVFTLLIMWYGMQQGQSIQRRRAFYAAGFCFSLAVSWELLAFSLTDFSLLCASPAVYLIAIAPFISKDESLPEHSTLGQACSLLGAILLLGPTLWLSFSHNNVAPSFLLTGESIALLVLGFITLVRFFVLSATALIIVATIHLLFLPSLGIPTFLALFLVGVLLIIIATLLLLIRSRLTTFWSRAM